MNLKKYQESVDKHIQQIVETQKREDQFLTRSYDILKEYLLRGGKRLRAIACIKAFDALIKKPDQRIFLPAVSVELFHASSLIHDDIMDEDELRRNKDSMHKIYQDLFLDKFSDRNYDGTLFTKDSIRFSVSSGIILGNILFSLGLRCITESNFNSEQKNNAMTLIQESYRVVNDGQLLDVLNEFQPKITEDDYINMAALKTGKLFAASLELGSIFAGADSETRQLFHDFGLNIAIAFQIQDDIMDISENMKKGNTLGSDIIKGKMTILMINALKNGNQDQIDYLKKISGTNASPEEIKKAVKIFHDTGSIKRAKDLAEDYVNKGKECLLKLKSIISIEGYDFFLELSDYMTKRNI